MVDRVSVFNWSSIILNVLKTGNQFWVLANMMHSLCVEHNSQLRNINSMNYPCPWVHDLGRRHCDLAFARLPPLQGLTAMINATPLIRQIAKARKEWRLELLVLINVTIALVLALRNATVLLRSATFKLLPHCFLNGLSYPYITPLPFVDWWQLYCRKHWLTETVINMVRLHTTLLALTLAMGSALAPSNEYQW